MHSTTSGGCQSVMNPGWGLVRTAHGPEAGRPTAVTVSSVIRKLAPMRWSVEMAVTSRSWAQPLIRTEPPVASPATR